MQLVAYGAQDIYLTGNPQITFFKVVYRRHTNFSMEAIEQTFNGTQGFGQSVTATISRNGDLVHRMYLEHDVTLSGNVAGGAAGALAILNNYGNRLMKDVELEIGGQRIDRHYGHWMSVWSQLSEFNPTGASGTLFNKMSGNGNGIAVGDGTVALPGSAVADRGAWDVTPEATGPDTASAHIFVPLQFWFCRNPGLALPLIALQYHEVKVKITFEALANLARDGVGDDYTSMATAPNEGSPTFKLFADYIYLDTDERRRFAQVSHEYLIEQVQHAAYSGGGSMTLNFNHPVKELIWSVQTSVPTTDLGDNAAEVEKVLDTSITPGTWLLKLNGHDRFSERDTKYFTRAQVWQHHTGGSVGTPDKIGVYSFALKPEEHQPSGTCNFSRIDNAQLVTTAAQDYDVYAVNYNVLRIMSGMGGLAYSN